MSLSSRELWTVIHGMVFGALFLLMFAGGWVGLYGLRAEWLSGVGLKRRLCWLKTTLWGMAVVAWATVISGTFIVYPWYRAKPPTGVTDLSGYPRYLLLADPSKAEWHKFGMEWKEHVGWLAPMAMTVVAFAVSYYGPVLARKLGERRTLMVFYTISFVTAASAGVFGAFINKLAPLH
jgi:hypothetical protein